MTNFFRIALLTITLLCGHRICTAQTWTEFSTFVHPEQPDTFVMQTLLHYGGTNAFSIQTQFSLQGIVIVTDDPTEGSTTAPTGTPNPNAPPPPANGANADEQAVAGIMTCLGYTGVTNQPFGSNPNSPNILPTDTNYLPGPPPGKYYDPDPTKIPRPDIRIEGNLFDIYSPTPTKTPKGIVDVVQEKTESQCDRIIVKLPDPPTGKTIDDVITEIVDEVNKKRKTPDNGIRDDLEELIVVKSDGTIKRFFPGGGVN